MYDSVDDAWRFRQTGLQIGFPEAKGNLFIGRTKEGYSMIKVMIGYHPWTQERSPALDAFVPILADGLKWMGYFPERRVFFSLGLFGDELSEDETFATYDHQVVTRIGWLPIVSEDDETLLHVAIMGRDRRSRRRQHPIPLEAGRQPGPLLRRDPPGSKPTRRARRAPRSTTAKVVAVRRRVQLADRRRDRHRARRWFHGGDAVAAWLITGETRGYNAPGGYFEAVSPTDRVRGRARGLGGRPSPVATSISTPATSTAARCGA